MKGVRLPRLVRGRSSDRPGRLRLAYLLAAGEIVVLGLVVAHPAPVFGARSPAPQAVAGGRGDSLPPPTVPKPVPPTTLAPPPTTTAPPPTLPPTPSPTPTSTGTTTPPARVQATPAPPRPSPHGIVPPGVPPANIPPSPNFLQDCSGAGYDDSTGCVDATLRAIGNARAREGLAPMTLPSNWFSLSPEEQLFVATDLERTARGLAPLAAMASALDQQAQVGASRDDDVGPPAGFPSTQWGANWAGAVGNPLEAVYLWMYDDGVGSANVDCTASNRSGCWGHRQNVLLELPCHDCVMGTAWLANGYNGDPSLMELLVETSGTPAEVFTWQQEAS